MPGSVSGGRLMAGMTEVRAVLAAAAVFRCSCCTSDLAAAASSRSLMTRYRRTRANALRTQSVAYRRIIAATAAAMSRKVMVFRRSVEWIRGSGSGGVDQGEWIRGGGSGGGAQGRRILAGRSGGEGVGEGGGGGVGGGGGGGGEWMGGGGSGGVDQGQFQGARPLQPAALSAS